MSSIIAMTATWHFRNVVLRAFRATRHDDADLPVICLDPWTESAVENTARADRDWRQVVTREPWLPGRRQLRPVLPFSRDPGKSGQSRLFTILPIEGPGTSGCGRGFGCEDQSPLQSHAGRLRDYLIRRTQPFRIAGYKRSGMLSWNNVMHASRPNKKRRIMSRKHVAMVAAAAFGSLLLFRSVRAEPPHAALVVGSANYASLPGIVGCGRSANAVSAALRGLNFQITERQDASTGGVDAGMSEFADHLVSGKGAGFVYICGYATDFNNRTFLLPTTARIGRPSDVITQGILAKSMLATVSRDPSTVAVVVFDLIPQPGSSQRIDLDGLANATVPDGVGIIAATETTTTRLRLRLQPHWWQHFPGRM